MMLRIVKNIPSPRNPKNGAFSFVIHLWCSSSSSAATKIRNPSPESSPMAEFLVKSCGLSPQKAASTIKVISKVTSVKQADSVRHFFKQCGLDDIHIRKAISKYPRIISANVERTLQPNLQSLSDLGFSEAELQVLISSSPRILLNPLAVPRIQFWKTFLGTDDKKVLVRVVRRNRGLLNLDIDSGLIPKISIFKKHGFSDSDIADIVRKGNNLILRSSRAIEALFERAKEIGFDIKSSSMILQGLSSLGCIGRKTFARKMKLLEEFGWSEQDVFDALKKAPCVIHLKEENIREKLEFLVARAGCSQSYIASRPLLLAFSLEKRIKPRYRFMEILKEKKLVAKEFKLFPIINMDEKKFVDKYVMPYEKRVPKIHEIYFASSLDKFNFE